MLPSDSVFYEKQIGQTPFFVFQRLERLPGFVHLITSRKTFTSLKDAGEDHEVAAGREKLTELLHLPAPGMVFLNQVHSSRSLIFHPGRATGDRALVRDQTAVPADGALLFSEGIFPVIRTADCLSVMVVDPERRCAGLFHAGWRGTRDRIVEQGLNRFLRLSGSHPRRVIVALGPCIRKCCYEVGIEVRLQFQAHGHPVTECFQGSQLDLVAANLDQIERQGITDVLDCGMCTSCHNDLFYSYRREKTTNRMWTLAGFLAK